MRSLLKIVLVWAAVATTTHAADSFSRALSPEEFSAAGLNKLTPAELIRLDELIHSQHVSSGRAIAATPGTPAASSSPAAATKETPKPGFLGRAKVMLTPGTEIEYSTLESTLLPPFEGWDKGTVLKLSNGQRWKVTSSASYSARSRTEPVPVKIVPGVLGSFFMEIDGGGRPKVELVSKP
jgi:hypothetical protein